MFKIHSVKALAKFSNTDEASNLLKRLVQATQALLMRRKWNVPLLAEFLPKQQGLLGLNINAGAKIMIRLREHSNNNAFLPWESLLGTLVHELVHIEIGAHSYEFYKLVDELWDEVQRDIFQGRASSTSTFFWGESQGQRLGGAPLSSSLSIRDLAASAAGRRLREDSSAGRRLGGTSHLTGLSQRELIAKAAERRARDSQACASAITIDEEEENSRSSQEVDLTGIDYCQPCEPKKGELVVIDEGEGSGIVGSASSSSSSSKRRTAEVVVLDEDSKENVKRSRSSKPPSSSSSSLEVIDLT